MTEVEIIAAFCGWVPQNPVVESLWYHADQEIYCDFELDYSDHNQLLGDLGPIKVVEGLGWEWTIGIDEEGPFCCLDDSDNTQILEYGDTEIEAIRAAIVRLVDHQQKFGRM